MSRQDFQRPCGSVFRTTSYVPPSELGTKTGTGLATYLFLVLIACRGNVILPDLQGAQRSWVGLQYQVLRVYRTRSIS
jgi:hypothetical protein